MNHQCIRHFMLLTPQPEYSIRRESATPDTWTSLAFDPPGQLQPRQHRDIGL
jgi:hypothetical protein